MKADNKSGSEVLRARYVGADPKRLAILEQERTNVAVASEIYHARKRAGMNQKQLAEFIGTTQSVISRLEDADYSGHTVKMLVRIAQALGRDLKVSMVDTRPVVQANQTDSQEKESAIEDLVNRCPAAEMARRGWIAGETVEDMRLQIRTFLGDYPYKVPAHFRLSRTEDADDAALVCWLTKIQVEGLRIAVGSFDPQNLQERIAELVSLSRFPDGPARAISWLERYGVRCVVVRHFERTYLEGTTMLLDDGKPAIGLTLRYDRLDNFWFTVLHEIGHLLKHQERLASEPIIDEEINFTSTRSSTEKQANAFAKIAWVSDEQWKTFRKTPGRRRIMSKAGIIAFASQLGVTPALVAGRLRFETGQYNFYTDLIGQDKVKEIISSKRPIY